MSQNVIKIYTADFDFFFKVDPALENVVLQIVTKLFFVPLLWRSGYLHDRRAEEVLQCNEETRIQETTETNPQAPGKYSPPFSSTQVTFLKIIKKITPTSLFCLLAFSSEQNPGHGV